MIIYNKQKLIDCIGTDCVGVTGDNLANTQEFYISGINDNSISYSIHLRFADGSVNTVTPSTVSTDKKGTLIRWVIVKNDIFAHGSFEVQLEGTNSHGLVFQTEIARLYADESIPIEDHDFENPNSETLKLREQAFAALESLKAQQKEIEENIKKIEQADVYTKTELDEKLLDEYYDADEIDGQIKRINSAINSKANAGDLTNFAGRTNEALENKADKVDFEELVQTVAGKADTEALNDYVLKTYLTKALKDKVDVGTYTQKMSQLKTSIASKFDSSNVESGTGEFTVSEQYANQANFDYLRIGNTVILNIRVYFKAQDNYTAGLALRGLPFVANYAETWRTITQNTLCSTYTINIPSGKQSTLYILRLSGTGKLPENHQMTETIIYTI